MTWMIGTFGVGPEIAYIDVAKTFQGSRLGRSQIAQDMDRLIGCLRVPYIHACPICKQADTPINLRRYPAVPEEATPPHAEQKQPEESQQGDSPEEQANILAQGHLILTRVSRYTRGVHVRRVRLLDLVTIMVPGNTSRPVADGRVVYAGSARLRTENG